MSDSDSKRHQCVLGDSHFLKSSTNIVITIPTPIPFLLLCCCLVDCGTPESLENGKAQYQSTTVGSQVTWSCNQGYTLVGPRTSVCGGDSTWSPAVPRCQLSSKTEHAWHVQVDMACSYINYAWPDI